MFKSSDGDSTSVAEDRLSAALYAKGELPAEIWIEGRARVDLRWIGGDFSSRERFRVETSREFTLLNPGLSDFRKGSEPAMNICDSSLRSR